MPESVVEVHVKGPPHHRGVRLTAQWLQAMSHSMAQAKLALGVLMISQAISEPALAASLVEGVHIPDPTLRRVLEGKLRTYSGDPITEDELATISSVRITPASSLVVDLTGLEFCHNLRTVYVVGHRVSDLTPLANLTRLEDIDFRDNLIAEELSNAK